MTSILSSRTKVFISYSHKDAKYLKRLQVHLADYERNRLIEIWDDTKLTPGAIWRDEIEGAIDSAKVAVLLVSADFLASEFVAESELPKLLTAAKSEGTIILPIILSPCGFKYTKLSKFQAVNPLSMPLIKMSYYQKEDLWARVANFIRDAIIADKSANLKSKYQHGLLDSQPQTEKMLLTGTETVLQPSEASVQGSFPAMTYKRDLGTASPGCFIFLLDQSVLMSNPFVFGVTQADGGRLRKSSRAADALNGFLNELIEANIAVTPDRSVEIKPRAEITVLGYGDDEVRPLLPGALALKDFVSLSDLQLNPADIELRKRKEKDATGKVFEVEEPFPIWVKPTAWGNAPMCAALQRARELAGQWVAFHPNSYPPIVINITGGIANDGDPTKAALRLRQVRTTDGQTLLYNVQISELDVPPILYPSTEAELPDDQSTKRLFSLSSVIPENSHPPLQLLLGRSLLPSARGFILNGTFESFRLMFQFHDVGQQDETHGGLSYGTERLALDEAMNLSKARLKVHDPDLRNGEVEKTQVGPLWVPWGLQGGFAVVYKFRTQSGKMRALRFFLIRMHSDIRMRYTLMGPYFAAHIPHITIDFKYHENGIILKDTVQGYFQRRIHPLIEMDWIEGVTLLEHINDLCQKRDRAGLADLHKKWGTLVQTMHQAKIAHGSLSGSNIMMRDDGSLVLVDYDSVYIPAFAGLPQLLLGQNNGYQHPQVSQRKFDEQMDNFSILVIQTALLALQVQPELWNQYTHSNANGKLMDKNFLFTQKDFLNPDQSDLMATLEQMSETRIRAAVQVLKQACRQSIDQVKFQLI